MSVVNYSVSCTFVQATAKKKSPFSISVLFFPLVSGAKKKIRQKYKAIPVNGVFYFFIHLMRQVYENFVYINSLY